MADLIVHDTFTDTGSPVGASPSPVNVPGGVYSVPVGSYNRTGGRLVCTNRDSFVQAWLAYPYAIDLSVPGANLKFKVNVNMAGVTGSSNVGVGFCLFRSGTNTAVDAIIVNYNDGTNQRQGLRFLRRGPALTGGLEYITTPGASAVFVPDSSRTYALEVLLEHAETGVQVTLNDDDGHSISYLETTIHANQSHGLYSGTINAWLDDYQALINNAALLISVPRAFQRRPMQTVAKTDVPVEFTWSGSGAPEGRFDPQQADYRASGSSLSEGLFRQVRLGGSTFYLRNASDTAAEETVENTGVGLSVAVLGNSNDFGLGASNWNYTAHASYPNNKPAVMLKACLNDVNAYAEALAPLHSNGGANGYPVLDSTDTPKGSWVNLALQPLLNLGDELDDPVDVPITVIPCAKPGQGTADWLPTDEDPFDDGSLFGAACRRIEQHGGAHLATIGIEIDCYQALSQAQTTANLTAIGGTLYALFGCKLLIRGPHQVTSSWWSSAQTAIQVAAGQACVGEEWCAGFVDNSSLGPPSAAGGGADGLHIYEQTFAQSVADNMAPAMRAYLASLLVESGGGGGGTTVPLIGSGLVF